MEYTQVQMWKFFFSGIIGSTVSHSAIGRIHENPNGRITNKGRMTI